MITVSGLAGAIIPDGALAITVVQSGGGPSDGSSDTFLAAWHVASNSLVLEVSVRDTVPGAKYQVKFNVTNPKAAQGSPMVYIESSGIVIQPMMVEASKQRLDALDDQGAAAPSVPGSAAPLYIFGPKLIKRMVSQSANTAWPGRANTLSVALECTVGLTPRAGERISIVVSGLEGVVAATGAVDITGASAASFTSDAILAGASPGSKGVWDQDAKTLTLHLKAEINPFTAVAFDFAFTNALQGQDPPAVFVEVTTNFEAFEIAPSLLAPLTAIKRTDREALLIKRSAAFTTKSIGQSSTAPSGANTITLTIKPQFDLTGDKNATVTISGLVGSMTPDATIKLLDGTALFNSSAK